VLPIHHVAIRKLFVLLNTKAATDQMVATMATDSSASGVYLRSFDCFYTSTEYGSTVGTVTEL